MMARARYLTGCLLALSLLAAGPRAAETPPAEEPAASASPADVQSYKSLRYDNKTGVATLVEGVIVHEGARIAADRIVYDTRKDMGTASGHVRFEGEQANVTSNAAQADFRARKMVFEGEVRFVTERAVEGEAPEKTVMLCTKLDYFYRERKGVATGPVRVERADQRASGDAAIYDGEAETFRIMGSVKVETDRNETIEAAEATLSLKDDTIDFTGPGKAQFPIEQESPAPE